MKLNSLNTVKKLTTTILSGVLVSGLLVLIPISAGHASPCATPTLTATIQYQGGTVEGLGKKKSKIIHDCNGAFAIEIPTRTNYVFAGWLDDTSANAGGVAYDGLNAVTTSWTPSAADKDPDTGYGNNFYLFAQWTPISYAVSYDFQGATGNTTAAMTPQFAGNNFLVGSYISGSVLSLPVPTKTGYTFEGWAYGGATRAPGYQFTMPANAVTFVAQWTPIQYSISFNANGSTSGEVPTALSYTTGNSPTAISNTYNTNNLARTNYTFGGWGVDAETTTALSSYSGLSNTTLYAIWLGSRYTVSFSVGAGVTGSAPSSQVDRISGSTITLPNPTEAELSKNGYILVGWSDGTRPYAVGASYTVPNGGITLSAVWSGRTYTITFDSQTATSGTAPSTQSYTVGTTFTRPLNPGNLVKTGYLFIGWQDSNGTVVNSSYTPTGSTTFSARWEANQYQILYDYYDGRGWATSDWYSSGKAPVTLRVPTKAGYRFDGWFDVRGGSRLGDSNNSYLTYAPSMACNNYNPCYIIWAGARWTANTYTISFDSNTATSGAVPANQSFTPGQAATVLSGNTGPLVKPFYSFGGWSATAGGTSKVTTYNSIGDKTFYAIWNPISYKVTFNSNGGSSLTPSSATSVGGALITLPTPTRAGYARSGWFDAASGGNKLGNSGATFQPNSAITIYAQWNANPNTVTFYINDGSSGTSTTQTITTGVATALTSIPFTRTGYTFAGWAINADGSGTRYTNGQQVTIASALTLYARWTANTYTVTFNANGGSGSMASQTITSGVPTSLRTKSFTRAGWTFDGWSTTQNGARAYSDGQSVTITSGLTLWARWTK